MANENFEKFDDLRTLDWDDTALVLAYNKGTKMRDDAIASKKGKGKKLRQKKGTGKKWKIGDYCRAMYYGDNVEYEAKIIDLFEDSCTVVFLGYDEEVELELSNITDSHGKSSRKKQIKKATVFLCADDSVSVDALTSDSQQQTPKPKKKTATYADQTADQSLYNYAPAESTFCNHHMAPPPTSGFHHMAPPPTSGFHHMAPPPPPTSGLSLPPNFVPPAPPMPQCLNVAQSPSLCAMLTSWYMAGYYTGLHQAQKGQCRQQCCGHSAPMGYPY